MKKKINASRQLRYPALERWREELKAGVRSPTTFDPLWRAACEEMNAAEAEAAGLPDLAAEYRHEAQRILREALKERTA